jgi:hypothetical protein
MSQERSPTLAAAIRAAIEHALRQVHVSMPGRIEAYDSDLQQVEVTPLLMERTNFDDPAVELPKIVGVPVVFPRAGGYSLTFGVKAGDTCLLVFSERSLDAWLKSGKVSDPADVRHHHLTDAVALMGMAAENGAIQNVATSGVRLGSDDSDTAIIIDGTDITINVPSGGTVNLGGSGTVQVAVDGDLAGPYPIQAKLAKRLKAAVGP